jgi:hypothetical protein
MRSHNASGNSGLAIMSSLTNMTTTQFSTKC